MNRVAALADELRCLEQQSEKLNRLTAERQATGSQIKASEVAAATAQTTLGNLGGQRNAAQKHS